MTYMLETRELFEAHLRTLQGLEYMVAFGPKDFGPEAPIGQGTWVIRKQNRRKHAGLEDEITILATYFVVGEHIYMAPSVINIIQARVVSTALQYLLPILTQFQQLSTTLALNKLLATASTLPLYTPALGHRYLLPSSKSRDPQLPNHSIQQSRENTPLPDLPPPTEPTTNKPATGTTTAAAPTTTSATASTQALYESFGQFLRYKDEYMDENPLLGEPGAFVFSSSKQQLLAQQELAAKKSEQAATALRLQTEIKRTDTPQPQLSVPPTPQPKTESLPVGKVAKAEKKLGGAGGVPKPKRRKSKAPPTPGSPLSVAGFK